MKKFWLHFSRFNLCSLKLLWRL